MATGDARIVIAERWSVLRRGLIGLLHGMHTVVDHFDDAAELATVVGARPVDLALIGDEMSLDIELVLGGIRRAETDVAVVILSDDVDADRLRRFLQCGARAVLSKKVDDHELLDALDRVLTGDRVIDQRYLPLLFVEADLDSSHANRCSLLTTREREVLTLLARGSTNREIADSLVLGESTIKTHLGRIYAKLEVGSRHQAVGRALELGILV